MYEHPAPAAQVRAAVPLCKEAKISESGSSFAKVLRSYQTGGITYSDFLGHVNRYLAAGQSPAELLEVLRRRQLIEPLPDFAHDAVARLLNEPSPPSREATETSLDFADASEFASPPVATTAPAVTQTPVVIPAPNPTPASDATPAPLAAASRRPAPVTLTDSVALSVPVPPAASVPPAPPVADAAPADPQPMPLPEKTVAMPRPAASFTDSAPLRSVAPLRPAQTQPPPAAPLQTAPHTPPAPPERTVVIPRVGAAPVDEEALRPRATPSLRPIAPHPTVAAPHAPVTLIPAEVAPDRWEKTVAIPRGADDSQPPPAPAAPEAVEVWPPAAGPVDLTVWPPRRGVSKLRVVWVAAAFVAATVGWFYLHANRTSGTPHPPQGIATGTVTPVRPPPDAVEPGTVIQDCPTCPRMIVLPPGRFKQGSAYDDHEALPAEKPQHIVRIRRPLAMAATELTVGNFREFVADTNRELPGCETYDGEWHHKATANWTDPGFAQGEDHPVACVSWNDAVAYAKWLSAKTGHRYRLPSASEWEYAARSGSDAQVPWSPGLLAACENANVADRSAARRYPRWSVFACKDGYVNTAPTGSFKANEFGLHDMLGNVFEWTQDCWHDDYAKAPIDGSARMDGDCGEHELRGGSWFSSPAFVRLAYRNHYATGFRSSSIGIRLVRELTP